MIPATKPPPAKKGDLKIDLELHSKLKAKAALSQPPRGLNELAEEHLWPVVGGQPNSGKPDKPFRPSDADTIP